MFRRLLLLWSYWGDQMKAKDDLTIARIRATRHRISQQFDHDPQKLVAHYIALQDEYRRRLSTQKVEETTATTVSESKVTLRESHAVYVVETPELLAMLQGED